LKIAGIILAGGSSSRMGQDKAQLLLDHKTLLTRHISLLSSLKLAATYVSGHYEHFQCIPDRLPQLGPIGGLYSCVETLIEDYDALFVMPVDMPLLSSYECEHLLTQFRHYPQGVYYQPARFPMILPLSNQLQAYLSDCVSTTQNNKQRSLYRLIKTVKLQAIHYDQENDFRFKNSNTPEEWADCLQTYQALKATKESS